MRPRASGPPRKKLAPAALRNANRGGTSGGTESANNTPATRHSQRWAARKALEQLFAAPSESVAVVAVRDDGRRVLYSHVENRAAADATIAALARVGLRAEVVTGIDPTTRPGSAVQPVPTP